MKCDPGPRERVINSVMGWCIDDKLFTQTRQTHTKTCSGKRSVMMGEKGNTGGEKSKLTFFTDRIIADLEIENKQKLFL